MKKIWNNVIALALGLFFALGSSMGFAEPSIPENIQFKPPDREPPSSNLGGMPRCGYKVQLSALVPLTENASYYGLTTSDRPILYFYNRDLTQKTSLFFAVYDTTRGIALTVYETSFEVSEFVGVIGLILPSEVQIQAGKTYRWYLEDVNEVIGEIEYLAGTIERIETNTELETQLTEAQTALDRAKVYAEAGIWYDALETLARERQVADTPELNAQWKSLLTYLEWSEEGFNRLVEAPFLEVELSDGNSSN